MSWSGDGDHVTSTHCFDQRMVKARGVEKIWGGSDGIGQGVGAGWGIRGANKKQTKHYVYFLNPTWVTYLLLKKVNSAPIHKMFQIVYEKYIIIP